MKNKYFIWGTGKLAERMNLCYANELNKNDIVGYIDNDKKKQGELFFEKEIFGPEILLKERECRVAIETFAIKEIKKQIKRDYPWISDNVEGIEFYRKLQVLNRYRNSTNEEIQEIVKYLEDTTLEVFNYDFINKYFEQEIRVFTDESNGLYYVMHCGKRMYFSRDYKSEDEVKKYYQSICLEQDEMSPHRYLTDEFNVGEGTVIIDAGVAEGNFSLEVVERAKKIYLFEPDENWVEALQYTFAPYKDKVKIINKCVSNYLDDMTTTIDNEVVEEVDLIKMDIEGEEYYALEGAQKVIAMSENIKCLICTYHQEFAHQIISNYLSERGFQIETSKGYMWYPSEQSIYRNPVLRRGLVRAERRR